MSKQEGIMKIEDDGFLYNHRVMIGPLSTTCDINSINVLGNYPLNPAKYTVDDLHIDVIETINCLEDNFFSNWSKKCMYGERPIFKDFVLKFNGLSASVFGACIVSYAVNFLDDEDIELYSTFKNYNFLKREVLFEKTGNEKIRVILSLILRINSYEVDY